MSSFLMMVLKDMKQYFWQNFKDTEQDLTTKITNQKNFSMVQRKVILPEGAELIS